MSEDNCRAQSAFAENRGETFADRARAARSQERAEREARRSAEINEILSQPCDGINEATTATFRKGGKYTQPIRKGHRGRSGLSTVENFNRLIRGAK